MTEWLAEIFGETGGLVVAATAALVVVLFLILALTRLGQRFSNQGLNKEPRNRLAVLEAKAVDPKRRLVLIRRDNVEHLLMVGGTHDLVVETNIERTNLPPAKEPEAKMQDLPEQADEKKQPTF